MGNPSFRRIIAGVIAGALVALSSAAWAQSPGGTTNASGRAAALPASPRYADTVVSYTPGSPLPIERERLPKNALGPPDHKTPNDGRTVSLGCGGVLVVRFAEPIANGDGPDLRIYEVGEKEPFEVALSEDGARWVPAGRLPGGHQVIDFAAIRGNGKYRFVRVTDTGRSCHGKTPGADIDAIEAIAPPPTQILRVTAHGDLFEGPPVMRVYVDQRQVGEAAVENTEPRQFEFAIPAGSPRTVAVEFTNDRYGGSAGRDRNLFVHHVELAGQILSPFFALYDRYTEPDIGGQPAMTHGGRLIWGLGGPTACTAGFAGRWQTNYGPMPVRMDGARLFGSYKWTKPGVLIGTVSGDTAEGTWIEANSNGEFKWTLDETRQHFTGSWTRKAGSGAHSGPWTGHCAGPVENTAGGPTLSLDKTVLEPGETLTVSYTTPGTYADDAWLGIVPALIEHGLSDTNDRYDVHYGYVGKKTSGTMHFIAPQHPGPWSVRLHDGDDGAREVASATFYVNPPEEALLVTAIDFVDHNNAPLPPQTSGGVLEPGLLPHDEPFYLRVEYENEPKADTQPVTLRWGTSERLLMARRSAEDRKVYWLGLLKAMPPDGGDGAETTIEASAGTVLTGHVLEAVAEVEIEEPKVRIVVHPEGRWIDRDSVTSLHSMQPFKVDLFVPRPQASSLSKTLLVQFKSEKANDSAHLRLSSHNSGTRGAVRYTHERPVTTQNGGEGEGERFNSSAFGRASAGDLIVARDMGRLDTEKTDVMVVSWNGAETRVTVYWSEVQQNLAAVMRAVEALNGLYKRGLRAPGVSRSGQQAFHSKIELIKNLRALIAYEADDYTDYHRLAMAEEYLGLLQSDPAAWRQRRMIYNRKFRIFQRSQDEIEATNHALRNATERYKNGFTETMRDLALGGYQILASQTGVGQAYTMITGRDVVGRRVARWERWLAGVDLASQFALMGASHLSALQTAHAGAGGLNRWRTGELIRRETGSADIAFTAIAGRPPRSVLSRLNTLPRPTRPTGDASASAPPSSGFNPDATTVAMQPPRRPARPSAPETLAPPGDATTIINRPPHSTADSGPATLAPPGDATTIINRPPRTAADSGPATLAPPGDATTIINRPPRTAADSGPATLPPPGDATTIINRPPRTAADSGPATLAPPAEATSVINRPPHTAADSGPATLAPPAEATSVINRPPHATADSGPATLPPAAADSGSATLTPSYARANANVPSPAIGGPVAGDAAGAAPGPLASTSGPHRAARPDGLTYDLVQGADGTLSLRRSDGAAAGEIALTQELGEGSTSAAYRIPGTEGTSPGGHGRAAKLTLDGTAGLDDVGRTVIESAPSDAIRTPAVIEQYPIRESVTRQGRNGERNYQNGTLTVMEEAPLSFRDAVNNQTIANIDGKMTPGQVIAFDRGLSVINERGYAWLDNKYDNFTFEPVGPPGSDQWRLVVIDTGGMVPLKPGNGRSAAQNARALQRLAASPDETALRVGNNDWGRAYQRSRLGEKFDALVDWDGLERATGTRYQTLDLQPENVPPQERLSPFPYNPQSAFDFPKVQEFHDLQSELGSAEAAAEALRRKYPLPQPSASPPAAPSTPSRGVDTPGRQGWFAPPANDNSTLLAARAA